MMEESKIGYLSMEKDLDAEILSFLQSYNNNANNITEYRKFNTSDRNSKIWQFLKKDEFDKEYLIDFMNELTLCEHSCSGDVYFKGDANNISYHVIKNNNNLEDSLSELQKYSAIKIAVVLMIATDGIAADQDVKKSCNDACKNFIKCIINSTDLKSKELVKQSKLLRSQINTSLINSFKNKYDKKVCAQKVQAIIKGVNIDFKPAKIFEHVKKDDSSFITLAQGYIGGLTEKQKKIIDDLETMLKNKNLNSEKSFNEAKKDMNKQNKSEALKLINSMNVAELQILQKQLQDKELLQNGDYVLNAHSNWFAMRNPNVVRTVSTDLKTFSMTIISSNRTSAAITGPMSELILEHSIDAHGLNNTEPEDRREKFYIDIREHASLTSFIPHFFKNRVSQFLAATVFISLSPVILIAAAVFVVAMMIKAKTLNAEKALSKMVIFQQIFSYREQVNLHKNYAKNNNGIKTAIASVPFGQNRGLTETLMRINVKSITAIFDEIIAKASKDKEGFKEMNNAYQDYKNYVSQVRSFDERLELIAKIDNFVKAAQPFANIVLNSGCAQNKDRGPAVHWRIALSRINEADSNIKDALSWMCMLSGGSSNGGSPGCIGSKASVLATNDQGDKVLGIEKMLANLNSTKNIAFNKSQVLADNNNMPSRILSISLNAAGQPLQPPVHNQLVNENNQKVLGL